VIRRLPRRPRRPPAVLALPFLVALALPGTLAARQAGPPPDTAGAAVHPGDAIRVVLLTMGPGDAVWEKFGHNGIWIRDPATGTDTVYNWGVFDAYSEDFLPRLVKGTMRYAMYGYPAGATLEAYRRANRDVWAQELNLTPEQRVELLRDLRRTDTDANRFYDYQYYLDNCSTRVRDALDRVLGGAIRDATAGVRTDRTWRWHARRILRAMPPAYVGMEVALGTPADRTITAWDEMFLPLLLRDRLRGVRVRDADGREAPLVTAEFHLVEATRPPPPADAPFWLPWFLAAGVALGASVAGAAHLAARGGRRSGLGRTPHPRAVSVAAGVLSLSVVGLLAQALPGFDQANGEVIAFALPAHLGVTWALVRLRAAEGAGSRSS